MSENINMDDFITTQSKEKRERIKKVGWGKEWWGKRPLSNYSVSYRSKTNKFFKRLLHKIERRNGKNDIERMDG